MHRGGGSLRTREYARCGLSTAIMVLPRRAGAGPSPVAASSLPEPLSGLHGGSAPSARRHVGSAGCSGGGDWGRLSQKVCGGNATVLCVDGVWPVWA